MAAEKSGLHQDVPVVCSVPSCPEKVKISPRKDTHIRIVGLVLSVAIVVTGFIGIVYILAPSESCGENTVAAHQDADLTKDKNALVNFDMDGQIHEERVSVANGGQLVTIVDDEDQFSVILDYSDGIAVVINVSAQQCYFFAIENFPDYQTDNVESLKPVIVQANGESPVKDTGHDITVANLFRTGVIPSKFIETTSDPVVADICKGTTSYWLESDTEGVTTQPSRVKRAICVRWQLTISSDGSIILVAYFYWC